MLDQVAEELGDHGELKLIEPEALYPGEPVSAPSGLVLESPVYLAHSSQA